MARRRRKNEEGFLTEVGGATLRLSHRVPLIGLVIAIGFAAGWWYFRGHPEVWGARAWMIACAVLGLFFGLIAVVGFLRNLFPEADPTRRRRR